MEISAAGIGKDEVEVSVADTGPGISDELKGVIFARFQRGKGKKSGKGLGLYIARIIVERYGGRIWAEDRVPNHPEQGAVISSVEEDGVDPFTRKKGRQEVYTVA